MKEIRDIFSYLLDTDRMEFSIHNSLSQSFSVFGSIFSQNDYTLHIEAQVPSFSTVETRVVNNFSEKLENHTEIRGGFLSNFRASGLNEETKLLSISLTYKIYDFNLFIADMKNKVNIIMDKEFTKALEDELCSL